MLRANGAALGHLRGEAPHRRARRHSSSCLVCQHELGLPRGGSHGVSEGGLVLRGPGAAALGASGVALAGGLGQSCVGGDEGQLESQGGRERGRPTLPAREVPASCPGVRRVGGRPGALPGVCQARMDRWVGGQMDGWECCLSQMGSLESGAGRREGWRSWTGAAGWTQASGRAGCRARQRRTSRPLRCRLAGCLRGAQEGVLEGAVLVRAARGWLGHVLQGGWEPAKRGRVRECMLRAGCGQGSSLGSRRCPS